MVCAFIALLLDCMGYCIAHPGPILAVVFPAAMVHQAVVHSLLYMNSGATKQIVHEQWCTTCVASCCITALPLAVQLPYPLLYNYPTPCCCVMRNYH